jgi:hypothetical protein
MKTKLKDSIRSATAKTSKNTKSLKLSTSRPSSSKPLDKKAAAKKPSHSIDKKKQQLRLSHLHKAPVKKATTVASHFLQRGKSSEPKRKQSVRSSSRVKDVKKSTQDIKAKKSPIKQHVTETQRRSSSPTKPISHALTNHATKKPATKGPVATSHTSKPQELSSVSKRAASLARRTINKTSSRHTIAVKLRTSSRSSKRVE